MGLDRWLRTLPASHRRWILVNAIALTAVVNLVVNGAIAWLSAAGVKSVPLLAAPIIGGPSTTIDTVGTLFLLPLITNLFVTTTVRWELRSGRLTPLRRAPSACSTLRLLPRHRTARGIALSVTCVAVLAPPLVALLIATNFGDISTPEFVLYQAILGVTLGAVVTPMIALYAMVENSSAQHPLQSKVLRNADQPH